MLATDCAALYETGLKLELVYENNLKLIQFLRFILLDTECDDNVKVCITKL